MALSVMLVSNVTVILVCSVMCNLEDYLGFQSVMCNVHLILHIKALVYYTEDRLFSQGKSLLPVPAAHFNGWTI